MSERHKTPIGEMWLEDGISWHRVDTADTITEDDASAVVTSFGRSPTGSLPQQS